VDISAHRRIFGAILELREKNCPIDYIAVAERIGNAPEDFALIGDLISGVVIERSHILHHVRIVRKKSRLRALMKLADWISRSATQVAADPDALVQVTLTKLGAIDNRGEVSA
jgi:replicative DNA helicase